jgi:hypothetical protein
MIAEEKKEKMFSLVEQWRKSTLSQTKFACQNGIKPRLFDYWCRKQSTEVVKVQKPTFIEIEQPRVLPGDQKRPQVEMVFPSGLCLKIY